MVTSDEVARENEFSISAAWQDPIAKDAVEHFSRAERTPPSVFPIGVRVSFSERKVGRAHGTDYRQCLLVLCAWLPTAAATTLRSATKSAYAFCLAAGSGARRTEEG
jgi:hypothetical protein